MLQWFHRWSNSSFSNFVWFFVIWTTEPLIKEGHKDFSRKLTVKCNLLDHCGALQSQEEMQRTWKNLWPQIPIKCDWSFDGRNGILASGGREILLGLGKPNKLNV